MTRRAAAGVLAELAALAAIASLTSCGLPGDSSGRTVGDDEVPYRLLETEAPTGPAPAGGSDDGVPVVFWLDGDQLRPAAIGEACTVPTEELAERLLDALEEGPSDDVRGTGGSSALPSDPQLGLVAVSGATAEVDLEPETSLSAERLPVAIGQVVLTLTSAPGVDAVVFVTDGGEVQVPLPGGVLTDEPVGAADYADLLPARLRSPGAVGCLASAG